MRSFPFFILFILSLFSCDRSSNNENLDQSYIPVVVPDRFPPMGQPEQNKLTREGVELGRMLFYDPVLDSENKRSCGTCHQQKFAFASPDHAIHGLDAAIMSHVNIGWDNAFLWNGKVEGDLEDIMLFEVKEFLKTDLERINSHPEYPSLFKKAFNTDYIDHEYIAKALAQFERTLISAGSKFDKYLRKEMQLTEQEYRGFNLFYSEEGDCFHCHGNILFKDGLFHNNGLRPVSGNVGRFSVTNDRNDMGKFKTPTLRNIELTAPYMHDNRYKTLEEVLDFYSDHVTFTEYTDPLMNHEGGINLTSEQKADLIAFLKTLTDSSFIENPAFSDPFIKK